MSRILFCTLCLCGFLTARAELRPEKALCIAASGENPSEALPGAPADSLSRMEAPTFRGGGVISFKRWVLSRLSFSPIRYEAEDEAHFPVIFVVDKKGRVKNIEVQEKDADNSYVKEVGQVMRTSPAWTPGRKDGDPIDVRMVLLFDFRLGLAADAAGEMMPHIEDITVYTKPDTTPSFATGEADAFRNWVLANLDYTPVAGERIWLQFIVGKDGSISDLHVKGTRNKELVSLLEKLCAGAPAWTPGSVEGEPVRARMVQQITFGTQTETELTDEPDALYLYAEVMPSFKGGDLNTFRKWIQSEIAYPRSLAMSGAEGRVIAAFVIEKDGSLSNIRILQSPHPEFSTVVVSALRRSPLWAPGTQAGQLVRVKYTLPVDFKIPPGMQYSAPTQNTSPGQFRY